ncbi:metallophosphoesterase [Mucilaginibacter pallidiroseus]|uniref:Metallophosphoesterase n=1 Tax=Mucilaginibacter pallidiroseus TaxID=2599295 RepID=A0A563UI21_9SPHI|nr:metallophosphoesterase [Mucilaginibacter pallidiroseus]TWR30943.1 metallophosphoesterase [Mucilaginibacter pallidiroseus]
MKNQLTFAHIGDLHITKAREQNYIDFLSIISQIEIECSKQLDFVFLPGDNADNGLPFQYQLVETALKMLSVPVHIIPGDHDMEQGSLENYYQLSHTRKLPYSFTKNGCRCVLLDVCGRGKGGPDFRLLDEQLIWLENEFNLAHTESNKIVLFMHTYPADLADMKEIARLNQLISKHQVVLVDMGHTHYNEISNDGHTIYSATRSTGQIEEGPVGYSLITIKDGVVSWRFKPLDDPFPLVVITQPADYRLLTSKDHTIVDKIEVEAIVFGSRDLEQVKCKTENNTWLEMTKERDNIYSATLYDLPYADKISITVEAKDLTGRPGRHTICAATPLFIIERKIKDGSNRNAIDGWPENGIFGTQLGPNQNGKPLS